MDTIRHVCKVSEEDWVSFFENLNEMELRANMESVEEGIFSPDEFDFGRFQGKDCFGLEFDLLEEVYWQAGSKLASCIGDVERSCSKAKSPSARCG